MIKVIINKEKFNIPTSWNDVNYSDWILTLNETDSYKIVSLITKIPLEYLKALPKQELDKIDFLLSFLKTDIDFQNYDIEIEKVDIFRESWGKKIEIQQLIEKQKENLLPYLKDIIRIYIPVVVNQFTDTDRDNIIYVFKLAYNLIEQLKVILDNEHEQLHVRPTSDQTNAGVDMYDAFGVMNTIRAVALGNILNFDEVLKVKYNVIFLYLKMNKTDGIFQENYRKILERKRK